MFSCLWSLLGHVPSAHVLSIHVPSGHPPSGHVPSGYVQPGRVPSGLVLSIHVPSGHPPSGHVLSGYVPSEYVPPGHVTSGYVLSGYVPSGYVPPGHVASGYVPSGQVLLAHLFQCFLHWSVNSVVWKISISVYCFSLHVPYGFFLSSSSWDTFLVTQICNHNTSTRSTGLAGDVVSLTWKMPSHKTKWYVAFLTIVPVITFFF